MVELLVPHDFVACLFGVGVQMLQLTACFVLVVRRFLILVFIASGILHCLELIQGIFDAAQQSLVR